MAERKEHIKILSRNLKEMNDSAYIKESNADFWYYTSLTTAAKILESESILISNMSEMNDLDEKNIHGSDSEYIHCFCLCNSNTEKIPMWYLYAGIAGKGVAIKFTRKALYDLVNSIESVSSPDGKVVLKKGKDFDIECGWIFYRNKDNPIEIKYRNKWYSLMDEENFCFDNYFIKSYPWEYEKEFRILVHNKTQTPYKQLAIDISPIYKRLKLKLAPEISNEEFSEEISKHKGFQNFFARNIGYSSLDINMNLFERNFDSFINCITGGVDSLKNLEQNKAYRVCEALKKSGYECK